jgi:hypothetical protein
MNLTLPKMSFDLTIKTERENAFFAAIDALRYESGKCNCYDKIDSCAACNHRRSAEWLLNKKETILNKLSGFQAG